MASQTLTELLQEAKRLTRDDPNWLLSAARLSDAIATEVVGDPQQLAAVRAAVKQAADEARCDLIVGASPAADQIVRGVAPGATNPTRALIFELVRVTGATLIQAAAECRHLDVVPAVLVDLQPSHRAAVQPRSVTLR